MPRTKRLITTLALTALGLAGSAAVQAAPALASTSQETIFQDDTQLHADTAGTLQTLKELGVDRVRVFVTWASIAPNPSSTTKPRGFDATDPASYPQSGFAFYDNLVTEAALDGIGVYFTVTGPAPSWAAHGGPSGTNGAWKPSAHEFGSFVTALAKRYSGSYDPALGTQSPGDPGDLPKVHYWGIWNEPDYGVDLAPQTIHGSALEVAPAVYRGLLDAAWSALHANGHGSDTILIGELAPRGQTTVRFGLPGTSGGMVPIRFLRALYCVDANGKPLRGSFAAQRSCPTNSAGSRGFASAHPGLFQATGFADHPYPTSQAPLVPTWPNGGTNLYTDWTQLPALEQFLDKAQRTYGQHRRFAIYNTEFGEKMPPVSQTNGPYYLNWFEYLSWRSSRLVSYDQYLLVNPPMGNFPSALEDIHGRKLAIYSAFRLPLYLPATTAGRGRSLEVWGDLRPAKFYPASGELQFQRGSRGAFTTIKTVTGSSRREYFDTRVTFPASGTVRIAWAYPPSAPAELAGTTVYSRSQKITIK